jgi:hypothetical protein
MSPEPDERPAEEAPAWETPDFDVLLAGDAEHQPGVGTDGGEIAGDTLS